MKLQLIGLSKEFATARRNVAAVKDLDMEINDREFFVLLGPSGCGKSTVLNLVAGLEKATDGEIWFGERLVAAPRQNIFLSPRERNVAMVFQSYALYPHLSVFDNIAFPLRIAGERNKESLRQAVERAASMLGIMNLLPAKPGELSGGQRQRVAIARAVVRHPTLFLLDEPLSNLDAQLRASTRTELKNLQRRLGITTLYVTHDQVEAMSLGDRVAVLRNGRLEQLGTPEALYEKPANTFVARFLVSPPINLLKVSLVQEDGALWLLLSGKKLRIPDARAKILTQAMEARECIFGIRPEHLTVVSEKTDGSFEGRLSSIEPLGREILLHTSIDDQEVTLLTTDQRFTDAEVGQVLDMEMDVERGHFFESVGTERLIC